MPIVHFTVMEDTLFNRTFRDSQGEIVIAQKPNLLIVVWLAATLLNLIPTTDNIHIGRFRTRIWLLVHLGVAGTISRC